MGATEEQMDLVALGGMDHVSYVLVMFSMASLVFLLVNMLVGVYVRAQNPSPASTTGNTDSSNIPGRRMRGTSMEERQRLADVEEFELDGLVSDDDDEETGLVSRRHKEGLGNRTHYDRDRESESTGEEEGLATPSTMGKNDHSRPQ